MKLRPLVGTVCFIVLSFLSNGTPLHGNYKLNPADSLSHDSIASALGRMAAENVSIEILENNANAALYEYKVVRTDWVDNFRVAGNLNEFTIKGPVTNTVGRALYPRYNVGVTLPMGIFVNQGKRTKAAFHRYQAELGNVEVQKQALRLQVMTLYLDYVRNQRLYELQQEVLQDAEFALEKAEERFSKGEINLEIYTATSKRLNLEQVQRVNLERDLAVARLELETLIGMPLNQALARIRTGTKKR